MQNLRKAAKLTQKQVADILGITVSYISKIENHAVIPSVENIARLADIYSVTTDEIFRKLGFAVKEKHIAVTLKKDGSLAASVTDKDIILDNDYAAVIEFI